MKKTIAFDVDCNSEDLDAIVCDLHILYGNEKLLTTVLQHVGVDAYLDHALRHHEKEFNTFYAETHEPEEQRF